MPNEVSIIISTEGLSALADMALAPKQHAYLDELLARNAEGQLSDSETRELDLLLKRIDELNLVKASAAATLHRLNAGE